jgi:hypothetical protein
VPFRDVPSPSAKFRQVEGLFRSNAVRSTGTGLPIDDEGATCVIGASALALEPV